MKEVIVRANPIRGEIIDSPIPTPAADEVLIKVIYAASNPKDWKYPSYGKEFNTGDDMAGIVEAVGKDVVEFHKGDRVAALHAGLQPHGTYAEYSLAPAHTTFHIPSTVSLQEASTIPLTAMTAALALHQELLLPTPWTPATTSTPLIVNGGGTAVGAFAIKLAKLAGIHPIIATAGKSTEYVRSLGVDKILDYRSPSLAAELRSALDGAPCYHAFDAVSQGASTSILSQAVSEGGTVVLVSPVPEGTVRAGVTTKLVMASSATYKKFAPGTAGTERDDSDFAGVMTRFWGLALREGRFTGHPATVVEGGLEGVGEGLTRLMQGGASATKFVYHVAEE